MRLAGLLDMVTWSTLLLSPLQQVMHRWCQQAPVVRFHFLGVPFVVVSDPQVIQHVLSNRDRRYAKDPYTFQQFSVLLGKGLVTSEGSLWRRQRALLTHVFRSSILHEVKDISFRAARRLVQHLNVHSVKGDVFKMAPLFRHQTLQVIGAVFGCHLLAGSLVSCACS